MKGLLKAFLGFGAFYVAARLFEVSLANNGADLTRLALKKIGGGTAQ